LLGFFAFAASQRGQAATSLDLLIAIAGNRHFDAAMIRLHFHPRADGTLDAAALDAALKSLYATGLFEDVKISQVGDRILATVVENPTIGRMAFEGNKKLKDDDLRKAVQSREGGPLSRAFVHDDVEAISELYRRRGYFEVRVEPKTIAVGSGDKNDRANLVFEIAEGSKLGVRQILFAGNNAYSASKLTGAIKTGATNFLTFLLDNDAYDTDRVEEDSDLIRRFYLARGYADVRVHSAASYEAKKKGVIVTFTIEEGPQYRFGRVDIQSSLKSINASAVRPYLHTRSGEVYDADAVSKTVEAIAAGLAKVGEPFVTVTARSDRAPPPSPPPPSGAAGMGAINLVYAVDEGKRLYVERIDIAATRGRATT
jgi:outer membrane protein insertion porin family